MASHVWFGGYSRRFINKFLYRDDKDRTDKEIDAMIRWVDTDPSSSTWTTNLNSIQIGSSYLSLPPTTSLTFDTGSIYSVMPQKYLDRLLLIITALHQT